MHRFLLSALTSLIGLSSTHAADTPVCRHNREECRLINQWFLEGSAAGNIDDLYDNRDRGHSQLNLSDYPQLGSIGYTPLERLQKRDWGAKRKLHEQIVIGNSSTSSGPTDTGSNPRSYYYFHDIGMGFLYLQYRKSNLFVYPEHRDYDPGHSGTPGFGDLFATNSPYLVMSQGSSGSDQPFLYAITHTLAALHPDVKALLKEKGALAPTLQAILRYTATKLAKPEEYLTGKAHPTVFYGDNVNTAAMVQFAHELTPEIVPAVAQLTVVSESNPEKDDAEFAGAFDLGLSETLATTPGAIARVIRGPAYHKTMVVSAEHSFDVNMKPLKYHWVVLRGDPDKITINPFSDGELAMVKVGYHDRRPISVGSAMASNRVDIGVFADNGTGIMSAPAFITFYTLDTERRIYDNEERLVEIDYANKSPVIEVTDWLAFFDMYEGFGFPSDLLRAPFTVEQQSVISTLAMAYRDLYWDLQGEATFENGGNRHGEITAEMQRMLEDGRPEFDGHSLSATVQARLSHLANHERLFYLQGDALDHWALGQADESLKERYKSLRAAMEDQAAAALDRAYHRLELQLLVMTEMLYPTILRGEFRTNFVDPRLSKPKGIRDSFEYDDQGRLVAWTRTKGTVSERHVVEPAPDREAAPEVTPAVESSTGSEE